MATLDLVVWEFVRIMVALEDEGADSVFYTNRAEVWDAVDGDLGRLAAEDAEAFSDMMMENQVTLEDVTPAEMKDIVRGVEIALEAIAGTEAAGVDDETQAAGLAYEKRELKALLKRLRGGEKAGGKPGGKLKGKPGGKR